MHFCRIEDPVMHFTERETKFAVGPTGPSNDVCGSETGAESASKVRGGAISVIYGCQVSLRVHYCKRDEVYFTTLL